MYNLKHIFDNRLLLLDKDISKFKDILIKLDPDINVSIFYRSIIIYNYKNDIKRLINKAIDIWIDNVTMNESFFYNLLSLGNNNYIIKLP